MVDGVFVGDVVKPWLVDDGGNEKSGELVPSCIGELALSCRVEDGKGLRGMPMSLMMVSLLFDEVVVAVVSLVLGVLDGIDEK